MKLDKENKSYSDEVDITPQGEMSEEKSISLMKYDIGRMISELNAHTKKSRFKSLAITELERVEYYLWRDLGNEIK